MTPLIKYVVNIFGKNFFYSTSFITSVTTHTYRPILFTFLMLPASEVSFRPLTVSMFLPILSIMSILSFPIVSSVSPTYLFKRLPDTSNCISCWLKVHISSQNISSSRFYFYPFLLYNQLSIFANFSFLLSMALIFSILAVMSLFQDPFTFKLGKYCLL